MEVNGEQNNTEWKDCSFEYCTFDDIKLCADISVIDGWFWNCKGKQLEFVIRQLFSNSLSGGKYEDVKICSDVTDNKLEDVEIQGLEKIDTERELDWSLNRFENCMINGKKK